MGCSRETDSSNPSPAPPEPLRPYDRSGNIIIDHNNAETYRHAGEVREWMRRREEALDAASKLMRDAIIKWAKEHSLGSSSGWDRYANAWTFHIFCAGDDMSVIVSESGSQVVVCGEMLKGPTVRQLRNALERALRKRAGT